jgi:single-strand DNA-binding protein
MQSGDRVASFSVATSESWKDKQSGERQERTEWHRISVFNQGLVTIVERFLKKGAKVYLEGQLETRKWTGQDGQERYTTEVVLRPYRGDLTMLDTRGDGAPTSGGPVGGFQESDRRGFDASLPEPDASLSEEQDDDIPF